MRLLATSRQSTFWFITNATTIPKTVSSVRPGRANIPASASFNRSRTVMPDRETLTGPINDALLGSGLLRLVLVPLASSVKDPSMILTRRDARRATSHAQPSQQ